MTEEFYLNFLKDIIETFGRKIYNTLTEKTRKEWKLLPWILALW
jgi:hypothetical protein